MELSEVKRFLRVDFDEDDGYITLLIDGAREYVTNAVGQCDETKALVKLIMLTFISNLYENRQYTVNSEDKVAYILRSMMLQLQYEPPEVVV